MYDELVGKGISAEVATVSGDKDVGYKSDRELTRQLNEVLDEVQPNYAFLVSDGAEDEQVYPIIASRIKVNHVKRVYVKQNPEIESAYYSVVKALKDDKIKRRYGTPLGLVLFILGFLNIIPFVYALFVSGVDVIPTLPALAPGLIALVLSIYILSKVHFEEGFVRSTARRTRDGVSEVRNSIMTGDFTMIFRSVTVVLALIGVITGISAATAPEVLGLGQAVFLFFFTSIWWYILAMFVYELGSVVDAYAKRRKFPSSFVPIMVFWLVVSFFTLIFFEAISLIVRGVDPYMSTVITIEIVFGLVITVLGLAIYRMVAPRVPTEDLWRH
jgi:putative membrane protein